MPHHQLACLKKAVYLFSSFFFDILAEAVVEGRQNNSRSRRDVACICLVLSPGSKRSMEAVLWLMESATGCHLEAMYWQNKQQWERQGQDAVPALCVPSCLNGCFSCRSQKWCAKDAARITARFPWEVGCTPRTKIHNWCIGRGQRICDNKLDNWAVTDQYWRYCSQSWM